MKGKYSLTIAPLFLAWISLCVGASSFFSAQDDAYCAQFRFRQTWLSDKYRLCWSIDNGVLDLAMQSYSRGWVAFGIGDQKGGAMVGGADIWQGSFSGSTARVYDSWSTSQDQPDQDRVQNVVAGSVSGYRTATVTCIRFRRLVDTGDTRQDRVITPGVLEIMVAYGEGDSLGDRHLDAALAYVDMFTGKLPEGGGSTTSTAQVVPANYVKYTDMLGGACRLFWRIVPANSTVNMALLCTSGGWIGFGFTNQAGGGMTGADIVVGQVAAGALSVRDYWSTGQITPQLKTTSTITATSGSRVNGITTMMWSRALNPGTAQSRSLVPGLMECLVAYSPTSDMLIQHLSTTRGVVYVDFYNGGASTAGLPAGGGGTGGAPGGGGGGAATTTPAPLTAAPWTGSQPYPNRYDVVPGVFELYWEVVGTSVHFAVEAALNPGWVGLGIAKANGLMAGSDIALASFDPATGAVIVEDTIARGQSTPPADSALGGAHSFTSVFGASTPQ